MYHQSAWKSFTHKHRSGWLTILPKSQSSRSTLKTAWVGVRLVGKQLPRRNKEVSASDSLSLHTSVTKSDLQSSFMSNGTQHEGLTFLLLFCAWKICHLNIKNTITCTYWHHCWQAQNQQTMQKESHHDQSLTPGSEGGFIPSDWNTSIRESSFTWAVSTPTAAAELESPLVWCGLISAWKV